MVTERCSLRHHLAKLASALSSMGREFLTLCTQRRSRFAFHLERVDICVLRRKNNLNQN